MQDWFEGSDLVHVLIMIQLLSKLKLAFMIEEWMTLMAKLPYLFADWKLASRICFDVVASPKLTNGEKLQSTMVTR